MKTLKRLNKQRVLQIVGALALLTQSNLASPLPLPKITSPANGAVITQPQVDIQISMDGYQDVQAVTVRSNGKVIGNAAPISFFGEWSFPDDSHISILEGTGGEVKIDYTPPDGAPMFLINGRMSGANTFSGSFIHWPGGGVTNTGNANASFTFSNAGLLTVVFNGQTPLGKRVVNGGLSMNTAYHFVWKNPPAGAHALTAVVTWLNSGTTVVAVTNPVNVAVKSPELPDIVIQQPKGSGLIDGASKRYFGTVKVGRVGSPKTFVIKNGGSATLTGFSITKTGRNAKDFRVVAPTQTSLAPGESTTFKVTFKPRAKGSRMAAISVKSNDPDENPFDIQLTGSGTSR